MHACAIRSSTIHHHVVHVATRKAGLYIDTYHDYKPILIQ